ncbi:MAG: restriction endonuclease [Planctomycetes bacterium]|nr:restriction endonuclease [Planctomycetota bacterium]
MNKPVVHVTMTEWETRHPRPGSGLEDRALLSEREQTLAGELGRSGRLEVTELRSGLLLQSFSHVGKVRLGDIEITVRPKLNTDSLLNLLRYAYGFRRLKLLPEASHRLNQAGFQDLLVSQLNAEVSELVARGLHRAYVPRKDWLPSPRGRIDISRLAAQAGVITASLPCTHHPRIEDSLLNQILLAGLKLAGAVVSDLMLRREARGLAALFEEQVSRLRLHADALDRGSRLVNRLTVAYEQAIKIISLLWNAQGITLEGEVTEQTLPGFLFDMNRFFQALLSRFLRENLSEHSVREEQRLRGMIHFVPGFNPRSRPPTIPRPDFVILRGARQVAILDAKYRDLWEKALPREMLYQLGIYAASHEQRSATILYPTTDNSAKEARIAVTDPVFGRQIALVCLRPVHVIFLEDLIMSGRSAGVERARRDYAERLAFGTS